MAELYVSPDSQTSIKSSIEYHFNIACNAASMVQTAILMKSPGNIIPTFRSFREHWTCIYLMASDKKDLDKGIISDTKTYLDSEFKDKDENMLNGIKIFEKFKDELFKKNVLVRG